MQLRPVAPGDDGFLFELFVTSRPEVATLPEPLLRTQFRSQAMSYKAQYPGAEHSVIVVEGRPVGQMMVDRSAERLHVVDIALVPQMRGQGVGTALLQGLQAEAASAGLPLRLSVYEANPARRLYERLGFSVFETQPPYLRMEWKAEV